MREVLDRHGWHLALAGMALMVPAVLVGPWAYALVAGATVWLFASRPSSGDGDEARATVESDVEAWREESRA